MTTHRATLQICGNALVVLAAISSLLRISLALFLVYSYVFGFTAPVESVQRWFPRMDHYSLDLVAILAPVLLLFMCCWDCVVLWGASHMRQLYSYRMSLILTLPALIPIFSPCLLLGLPFAWMAHRILRDSSSRQYFAVRGPDMSVAQ